MQTISDDLIKTYMSRLINQNVIWGKQYVTSGKALYAYQKPDMDTKGGRYQYESVTPNLVHRLLLGHVSCAWVAIDENDCSKWLCFDSDTDDGDLDRLEAALRSWGLYVLREGRRPGRAGHLWVLFDVPIPAKLLIMLGDMMVKLAGIQPGIERFPKGRSWKTVGLSQVRGPLSINLKPEAHGARGWFDGAEQNIQAQLEFLSVQPLNRANEIIREATRYNTQHKKTTRYKKWQKRHYSNRNFPILNYITYRTVGNEYVAQCPLCALEGHDRHRDNLHITLDGSKFCCVFRGPNLVHKIQDIHSLIAASIK